MRTPVALLAALALTSACGVPDEADAALTSPELTTDAAKGTATRAASWSLKTGAAADGRFATAFAISSTNTVYFAADAQGLANGHYQVAFEVRMPDGSTFARYDVAVAVGVAASPGEQVAQAVKGGVRIWASMPVAGTIIDSYGITGYWSANVAVNGGAAAASTAFQLN